MEQQVNHSSNKKGFIGILSVIIVLALGALGVFAYNQFVNKNPLVQYAEAEKNTFDNLFNYMDKYYGDGQKINDKLLNEAYESTLTLSASTKLPPALTMEDPMVGIIQGIISGVRFVVDTKVDPSTNEAYAGMDLKIQGNSLFNANVYQNEKITALKLPEELYEEYFVLQNKKLGDFLRKNGAIEVPIEEIPHYTELLDNAFTAEMLKELATDYLDIITENISEENVTITENVDYKGGKFKKLSFHFSEREVYQLLTDLLTEMKDDERFVQTFGTAEIQEEEISFLIDNLEYMKLPNGLTYDAYMTKKNVAYRVLTVDITGEYEDEIVTFELNMDTVKKSSIEHQFNLELRAYPNTQEGQLVVSYKEDGQKEDNDYVVERDIHFAYSDEWVDESFGVEANTVYNDNTSETTFNLVTNFADTEIPSIGGFLNTSAKDEGSSAEKTFDLGIDFEMNDPWMGNLDFNVTLSGENEITFTDDLDFPSINENNSVQVFDLSLEELEQIFIEIEDNGYQYYESLFGGFGF